MTIVVVLAGALAATAGTGTSAAYAGSATRATPAGGTAGGTMSAPGAASMAKPASLAANYYAGYLSPGAVSRTCFQFNGYSNAGPALVTGTAREYGVVVTTVSTDMEYLSGTGWLYCATLQNVSAAGSGVDVAARAALTSSQYLALAEPTLAAGATGRYCFNFNNHSMTGPVTVTAAAYAVNVDLVTVSTDLENRQNYGWVYCATIRNASSASTAFTLIARSGLGSTNAFNYYSGYLAAGATGRYCFNYPATAVPVAVTAAASEYNTILTTVSTDRENRLNYGLVYCATIRNSSATGSGINLQTLAGF